MSRRFQFTYFGDNEPVFNGTTMRYLCYQREMCPSTGRLHWQGYVSYYASRRFTAAYEALGLVLLESGVMNGRLQVAKGSAEQNRAYCSKEDTAVPGTFREHGVIDARRREREDGSANSDRAKTSADIEACIELVKNGESMETIVEECPRASFRFLQNIEKMCQMRDTKKDKYDTDFTPPYVEIRWGTTGTGKTSSVTMLFDEETKELRDPPAAIKYGVTSFPKTSIFTKQASKWWCGYNGEPVIVIDEFTGNSQFGITLAQWNSILDGGLEKKVESKGGQKILKGKQYIFTSNIDPLLWWVGEDESARAAFMSRVCRITKFSGPSMRTVRTLVPYDRTKDVQAFLETMGRVQEQNQPEQQEQQELPEEEEE